MNIKVNDFVQRQTKNSRFSYFDGTWDELEEKVKQNFLNSTEGDREGVILVSLPPERFYTSLCKIDEDFKFKTKFESRREGEAPSLVTTFVKGKKTPAKVVNVVLYSHSVLLENNENSTDADWEIISINASVVDNEPMQPITMARNMLGEVGGTKVEYTGQQFAEAIWFWREYIMYDGED